MLDGADNGRPANRCFVKRLEQGDERRWNDFVADAPQATFFHLAAWRGIIEQVLGHRCHYLYVERDGVITGILPLAEIRSRLFGHALISTPFCVYGGVVASDPESEAQLTRAATALADELRVDYLELRDRELSHPEWPVKDLYVSFRKAIDPDHDKNLKAIPRKQRAMVRKGIQRGLVSVVDRDTDRLHRIYAESVRNLGTPVFPRRYFRLLAAAFGEDCDVLTVLDDGAPIASVLNFYFRDEVLPYYGGGTAEARQRAGNDFMYWEVMRRAAARGCRVFDFGRSKEGTGSYAFKRNWGFEPTPLHYRFLIAPGAAVPELNPLNPKFRLFIAAWKRLPLPVANMLGPQIVRGLG